MFGVPEQGDHRVAHEVGGGFVAGRENQSAERKQVVFVELVPVVFGLKHGREQIVSRFGATLGEQGAEVGEEIPGCPAHGCGTLAALEGIEDLNEAGRPLPKLEMVLARYAQQFCDGDERKRVGEIGNEFHGAGGRNLVEQAIRHLLKARAESFDSAGREGLADQATQSPVVLAFDHEEIALEKGGELGLVAVEPPDGAKQKSVASVGAGFWTSQHLDAVVVAGDEMRAEDPTEKDRLLFAEALEGRIRVAGILGEEGIEVANNGAEAPQQLLSGEQFLEEFQHRDLHSGESRAAFGFFGGL